MSDEEQGRGRSRRSKSLSKTPRHASVEMADTTPPLPTIRTPSPDATVSLGNDSDREDIRSPSPTLSSTAMSSSSRKRPHESSSPPRGEEEGELTSAEADSSRRSLDDDLRRARERYKDLKADYASLRRDYDTLRRDNRRLRDERQDAEIKASNHKIEADSWKGGVDRLSKTLKYQEYKSEQLRRELVTRGRARSPQHESSKHAHVSEQELLKEIAMYEISRDIYGDYESESEDWEVYVPPKSKKKKSFPKATQRAHQPMTVDKPATPPETSRTPLEERIAPRPPQGGNFYPRDNGRVRASSPPPRQPASSLTGRPTTETSEFPREQMAPLLDRNGNRIAFDTPRSGWCLVYGRPMPLGSPFPDMRPDVSMINPLTGTYWTMQELELFPNGFPGWPAHWPAGRMTHSERNEWLRTRAYRTHSIATGPNRAPPPVPDFRLISTVDRSRELLRWLPGNPDAHAAVELPWRFPETAEETQRLREVAWMQGNLEAFTFWGKFVDYCNRIPKDRRMPAEVEATGITWPRPLWAPYKQVSERQKEKKRLKKIEKHQGRAAPPFHPQPPPPPPPRRHAGPFGAGPSDAVIAQTNQYLNTQRAHASTTGTGNLPTATATRMPDAHPGPDTSTSTPTEAHTSATLTTPSVPQGTTTDVPMVTEPAVATTIQTPHGVTTTETTATDQVAMDSAAEHLADVHSFPIDVDDLSPNLDNLDNWVRRLGEWYHVELPGLVRDASHQVSDLNALRGLLIVARLGPHDNSGRITLGFIRRVAEFIRQRPITAEQFVEALPITVPATIENLNSYLDDVQRSRIEYIADAASGGLRLEYVRAWLARVIVPVTTDSTQHFPNLGPSK